MKQLQRSIHKTLETIKIIQNIQENQQKLEDNNHNIIANSLDGDLQKDQEEVKQNNKKNNKQEQKLYNSTKEKLIQLDENEEIEKEYDLYEILNFDEIDENIENEVISEMSKLLKMYIIGKDVKVLLVFLAQSIPL